ncbi:hypothetical protein [Bacillus sp. Bos-x628]|uniref:hypothetical protein n=1 Tax=Bacillus maqinnsis TaxID=3229854 RepID=UPI00338DC582
MKSFKHEDFKVGQIVLHKWGIIGEVIDTTRKADAVDFRVIAFLDKFSKSLPESMYGGGEGEIWESTVPYIEDILGYTDNYVQPTKEEEKEEETLTTFQAELTSEVRFIGNRKDYVAFIEGVKSLYEAVNRN